MKNPIINNPATLIASSIVIVIISVFVCFFIGVLAYAIFDPDILFNTSLYFSGDYSNQIVLSFTKTIQIFQSIGLFVIPPIVIAFLARKNVFTALSLDIKPNILILILAGIAIIVAMPLIDIMAEFNSHLSLPTSLSWIEEWMRESEIKIEKITKIFLETSTVSGLFLNLFMIALIPAIGEELMFRGFIQNFIAKRLNIHISIFISAFIFSAIHLQFFGFLPRLAMGMFFGYLLYWSGSLWLPMFAHFVNNAAAVIITYKMGVEQMSSESLVDDKMNYTYIVIASLFITTSIIYAIYKFSKFYSIKKVNNT